MDFNTMWTKETRGLSSVFEKAGHEIRLVGGCVRDRVCFQEPKDLDFATDATPIEMLNLANRLGLRTFHTLEEVDKNPGIWERGALKHGTVPFIIDGEVYEITTLREDVDTNGRHAEVRFVRDFRTDAARRDLTFNAMSVDASGKLYDYFGGQDDIENSVVRFIGNPQARIQEDFLRILRFFRFRARFGPTSKAARSSEAASIDLEQLEAIRNTAKGLRRISGERIWMEMEKILVHPKGFNQVQDMATYGVMNEIDLPIIISQQMSGGAQAAKNGAPAAAVLGMILAPAYQAPNQFPGIPNAAKLAERWKFSRKDRELAAFIGSEMRSGGSHILSILEKAVEPRANPEHYAILMDIYGRHDDARRIREELPIFPVTGKDLVNVGVAPGPELGERMNALRREWKDSAFTLTKDELLGTSIQPNYMM